MSAGLEASVQGESALPSSEDIAVGDIPALPDDSQDVMVTVDSSSPAVATPLAEAEAGDGGHDDAQGGTTLQVMHASETVASDSHGRDSHGETSPLPGVDVIKVGDTASDVDTNTVGVVGGSAVMGAVDAEDESAGAHAADADTILGHDEVTAAHVQVVDVVDNDKGDEGTVPCGVSGCARTFKTKQASFAHLRMHSKEDREIQQGMPEEEGKHARACVFICSLLFVAICSYLFTQHAHTHTRAHTNKNKHSDTHTYTHTRAHVHNKNTTGVCMRTPHKTNTSTLGHARTYVHFHRIMDRTDCAAPTLLEEGAEAQPAESITMEAARVADTSPSRQEVPVSLCE